MNIPFDFSFPNKIVVIDYHIFHPTHMWYYENGFMKCCYEYHPEETGIVATDKELFEALQNLVGDEEDIYIDISASAASFIEYIKHNSNYQIHKWRNERVKNNE